MRTSTLLPDGRRLVVDAVLCSLAVLLATLLLAAVLAPSAAEMAAYLALMALYLVSAQIVQAILGQLVLVRIASAVSPGAPESRAPHHGRHGAEAPPY